MVPTPVFLPGELHGQRNLVGYSPWGRKESDTTEQLTHTNILKKKKKNHFPHTVLNAQERLENKTETLHILGKCGK